MGLRRLSGYLALTIAAASPAIGAAPSFGGCPAFPADNYWNTRVDNLAVHPSSAAWVNSIGATARLHPDCCNVIGEPYGFSPTAVPGTQPLVPITYYPTSPVSESDPGPFPIPPALAVGRYAGSSDREVVVVNAATCTLYELYGAPVSGGSSWIVDSSAKWDLRSNALRPEGHISADRAGLPMLPGLMRWQEVAAGEIGHAIRFTASNIWGQVAGTGAMKYLWPARHGVGTSTDATLPPLGARLRLKASFDISGFDARTQVILRAFKKYGIVLSSAGGNWYLQGDDDALWPDSVVAELRSIAGGEFEVVDTAPMMVNVNSGQAVQLAPPPDPTLGELSAIGRIVAGSIHTCALTTEGGVKCWGSNAYGQVGDNSTPDRLRPVDVSGLGSGVVAITAGGYHTCALTTAGGVKCWGDNVEGQLGDNSTADRLTPVDVSGLGSAVAAITAGDSHTCALTTGGGVRCWGANAAGQLGDNSTTLRLTPVAVLASAAAAVSDAPTIVSVTPGSGQVTIAFTAPVSDGGSPITSYTVTCNPGSLTATGTSSPITVTGLASGTSYSCSVAAIHASGPGTSSNSVTVTLGVIGADDSFPPGGVPSGWMQPAGSNAAWVVANDAAYAGSLSLKSGFIAANQKSEIAYRANFATGNVTFARKVSGQAGAASLEFHIDGIQQAAWPGEQDWAVVSFAIPAGIHTLMWRFVKGAGSSSAGDAAWIDSVVLPARAKCRVPMGDRRCVVE